MFSSRDELLHELSTKRLFLKRGISQEGLRKISEAIDQRFKTITDFEPNEIHRKIASLIDHTLLVPHASEKDIKKLCDEAEQYRFRSVCAGPIHIALCRQLLAKTGIKICTVIGFPLGFNTTATKVFEAQNAESLGADEIDMVMNIGALKDRNFERARKDISEVVHGTSKKVVTKVILENACLTFEEKIVGCLLAKEAGADFVKTSTGFASTGASAKDIILMRFVVGDSLGVKAAGGIRDYATAVRMIKAGADRIGSSSSVKIVNEEKE